MSPFTKVEMSPFNKDKMFPVKGTESGQITKYECDRIESVGSDAAASRETAVTERGSRDAGRERKASQTVTEELSPGRRKWVGEPTAWEVE